jgi:hypothetical protein
MKKLDALVAGFADEVFRIIRSATLEELAELVGSAPPPAQRVAARAATPRAAPAWPPLRGSVLERSLRARRAELEERAAPAAPPLPLPQVGGEITDPERLLRIERIEADVLEAPSHPEPSPEPPPVSTEMSTEKPVQKPVPSAPVLLRANEALVRASNAGIVIRRRKGA